MHRVRQSSNVFAVILLLVYLCGIVSCLDIKSITLPRDELEDKAAQVISKLKSDAIFGDDGDFIPAHSFFRGKERIEASPLFDVMKKLPKTILHVHSESLVTIDWLIANATYRDDVLTCVPAATGKRIFRYESVPPDSSTSCTWSLVVQERQSWPEGIAAYDAMLYDALTIVRENPEKAFPTQDIVWDQFAAAMGAAGQLLNYDPVFDAYLSEMCEELVEDGTLYVEIRTMLYPVFSVSGEEPPASELEVARRLVGGLKRCADKYPADFVGGKVIYTGLRSMDGGAIADNLEVALRLRQELGDDVAGFDLVGYEDPGHPLKYFRDEFEAAAAAQAAAGVNVPYFFHAGETNWWDTDVGANLEIALLDPAFRSVRLGHAFALQHFNVLQELVKTHDIALEICPISNQVLKLVADLRNHPAADFIAAGLPVTISPDDPGAFGVSGASYDFYEAFMAFGGGSVGLRTLKELSWNGLKYSGIGGPFLPARAGCAEAAQRRVLLRGAAPSSPVSGPCAAAASDAASNDVMAKRAVVIWERKWHETLVYLSDML